MIKIIKGQEPASWLHRRLTPGTDYEATDDLKESLLKEQGYICAYCMRRIPVNDNGVTDKSRIEHFKPRESMDSAKERMDYSNLLICCPGAMSGSSWKNAHCDRKKGSMEISFSPTDLNCISTLSYGVDGTIQSTNEIYNKEINDILNLNLPLLKSNRKNVREAINRKIGQRGWSKGILEKLLHEASEKDGNGRFQPYCGVLLWYLDKKLRQLNSQQKKGKG